MNGIHWILVCPSDITLLSENISTSKKKTALLVTSTETGLEANMSMSHNQTEDETTIGKYVKNTEYMAQLRFCESHNESKQH